MSEEWNIPAKDMFAMMQGLQKEMSEVKVELQLTRSDMKAYNGLRQRIDSLEAKITELEKVRAEGKGIQKVWEGIRVWGGWLLAIASFLFAALRR